MHILAMLTADGLGRLRTNLPRTRPLQGASVVQLRAALESSRSDTVILDPCHVRRDLYGLIVDLAARSGARVVFYCGAEHVALRRVLEAARLMPVELIIPGSEDECELLLDATAPGSDMSVPALVLHGLAEPIRRIRPVLATAAVGLFGGRAIPATVREFLEELDAHPRTVRTRLARASLTSVSDLLWCARIAKLHRTLVGRRETLECIASRSGTGARTLASEFNRLAGLPPRQAVRELEPVEIARRLAESVMRRGAANTRRDRAENGGA